MAYITRSRWNEIYYSIAYLVCQQFFYSIEAKDFKSGKLGAALIFAG